MGVGARASLPPKSMSLLTWAEENLTALETCPSEVKEEAAKQLEPEKVQKWQASSVAHWGLRARALHCAFTDAQSTGATTVPRDLPAAFSSSLPL